MCTHFTVFSRTCLGHSIQEGWKVFPICHFKWIERQWYSVCTRLQKASAMKDLLRQKMLLNFMSSSQARWAKTSERMTSLTFSEVFLFCTPIHTSVTEVPVYFFTMVSQCYHHDITLSHFIPMEVTVSAAIWICQHKLLWNHHGKLLWKVSRLDSLPKTFNHFLKWYSIKCFWKETTASPQFPSL